jgi:hypothetical protein
VHVCLQLVVPVAPVSLPMMSCVKRSTRSAWYGKLHTERRALDADALEQEQAEIDLLELAPAEEAEHDHAAVRRERGNVLAPVRDAPTTPITTSAPCPPVARSTSLAKYCIL